MGPNEYFLLSEETGSQKYEINLYIKNGIQNAIKSLTLVNRHLTFVKMQQSLTFVFKIVSIRCASIATDQIGSELPLDLKFKLILMRPLQEVKPKFVELYFKAAGSFWFYGCFCFLFCKPFMWPLPAE